MRKLFFCLGGLLLLTSSFTGKRTSPSMAAHPFASDTIPVRDTTPIVTTDTDTSITFIKAEIEPQFIGGEMAWRKFLEKNLNAAAPVDNNAPFGSYTVVTQFIVEKDGTATNFTSLTKHGYGLEEECIRTIKLVPRWQPATQSGRPVRCYKKQPITFILSKG